jgi:hypothetical protein
VVPTAVNSGPVSCVYRAYERGRLVATGRLMLDTLPNEGDEVTLNGRQHVVRSVDFGSGEHVLELEPIELTPN